MKILITSDFYLPTITGVTNVILVLKDVLEKKGHDVRILTFKKCKKSYYDTKQKVYFFRSLKFQFYKDSLNGINTKDPLMNEIYTWKPDIIHSQTEFFSMRFAKKIAKQLSCPIIHTCHTNFERHNKNFHMGKNLYMFIVKFLLKKSLAYPVVKLITPSKTTKDLMETYNLNLPISVIPSGIDLKKFTTPIDDKVINEIKNKYNIKKDKFNLITISRLSEEKHVDDLIKFFSKLVKTNNKIQLIIVGDGPEMQKLVNLTIKLELSNNIIFCGAISPDIINLYYKLGNLFISAATKETQGLTYYEALASGLPIICKNDPVLDGLLIDNYNGYIFNTEKEFLDIINNLVNNPEHLESMKNNTKDSVTNINLEQFANNIINEYNSLIE
jgi:1,2-diacylglycerol 3-alpha-glucosyltransferase